jgi:uncharacterized protein YndB with AHSA1/START domain
MTESLDVDETSIHVDEFLPYPPPRVWQVLTDPAALAQWLMPNDFEPRVGHRFTFRTDPVPGTDFDGIVECEVLVLEPPHLMRISWAGGPGLDTTVTWRLEPEGTGTRLFLDHEGFESGHPGQQFARQVMGDGWRSHIMARFRTLLEPAP